MKTVPDNNRIEWQELLTNTGELTLQNYFFKAKVIQLREQVTKHAMPLMEAVDELHQLCINMFDASYLQGDLAIIFEDFEAELVSQSEDNVTSGTEEEIAKKEYTGSIENVTKDVGIDENISEGISVEHMTDTENIEEEQEKSLSKENFVSDAEPEKEEISLEKNNHLPEETPTISDETTEIPQTLDNLELERKRAKEQIEKRLNEIKQNKGKKFVPKKKASDSSTDRKKTEKSSPKKPGRRASRKKKGFWDNLFG